MPEAKCPKCGKEIEYLSVISKETAYADWDPEDGYDLEDTKIDSLSWQCPECGEELFKTEEEAKEFFEKGGA